MRTRRSVLTAICLGLSGCLGGPGAGTTTATGDNPALGEVTQQGDLELRSPAFDDGGRIPEKYGKAAANVNPPLRFEGVPGGTESFVLIVDDPDAVEVAGHVWLHWLVWNIPATRRSIPEGWNPKTAIEGKNDFGNRGYDGPKPPERHTYRFKLFALDTTLDLPRSATEDRVGRAMREHILAATQLTGYYVP